jgi:thioredoxin
MALSRFGLEAHPLKRADRCRSVDAREKEADFDVLNPGIGVEDAVWQRRLEQMIVTCPNCGAKNRVDERAAMSKQPVCGRCGTKLVVSAGAGAADGHPVEVTDATFEQLISSAGEKPVLIDCWAAWCGPCRMLAPTIEALASESDGRYVIAKLDTDKNPQTASRYRINSIPTMLIFKRGQLVDQLVGVQPRQAIEAKLGQHG